MNSKKGFTFVEVMFVMVITIMVLGSITSAWLFAYKSWTSESERTFLRIDLIKALETMKNDIRLSSLTYISFYPAGGEPYTAISLPVAETDSNGFFGLNATDEIDWDKTVIYHLYTELSGEQTLRRTVIDPRDNTLTDEERYTQLFNTVANGEGPEGSTTDMTFLDNIEIFEISSLAPIIDFYTDSSDAERDGKIVFGWAKLAPGDHTIRFEITGKNSSSAGHDIGVDSIMIEPSGGMREMEYYASSFAPSGSLTASGGTATRMYNSIFGNENYLEFDASLAGDYMEVQDYYDLWRESSFDNASLDNSTRAEEEVRVVLEVPEEDEDGTMTWFSYSEAGDPQQDGNDGTMPGGVTPPVVIRTVVTQDNISDDGDLIRVKFRSSTTKDLIIERAYITKRDGSSYSGFANQSTSGREIEEYHRHQQLFFRDEMTGLVTQGIVVPADSEIWSVWTAYPLREDSDYLVTMYVEDTDSDETRFWNGAGTTDRTYYLVGGSYSTKAGEPDWSSETPMTSRDIFITAGIDMWKSSGGVESQIYDTTLSAPIFNQIKWSEWGPAGTEITMKARASSDEYMSGATDWDLITGSTANPQSAPMSGSRYIQFKAELESEPYWQSDSGSVETYADYIDDQVSGYVGDFPADSGGILVSGMYTTWIDDVEIDWPGEERICTITGYIARKNDYGQAKILVDGEELLKILSVKVKISKDVQGREVSEENIIEVEPRNTGK